MKMVKSLLLGSSAGLMAVAGAQAADLPVKAAPVEYVKVCNAYGAGFYYMPGTDICLKIGGYVRGQYYMNNGNSGTNGYYYTGATGAQQQRAFNNTNDFILRTRAIFTMDARSPTDWGTVRAYVNLGWTQDSPFGGQAGIGQAGQFVLPANGATPTLYANRAFVQWAGFTFGKAQSFWDVFPLPARTYFGLPISDTGDTGVNLAAYTFTWGNGVTTTFGIEEPRRMAIFNADALNSFVPGVGTTSAIITNPALIPTLAGTGGLFVTDVLGCSGGLGCSGMNNDSASVRFPDVVSNFRIDQAWGTFQVMGAIHDVAAAVTTANLPFGNCTPLAAPITAGPFIVASASAGSPSGAASCGHPADKVGWAAGFGGIINTPFVGKGDTFSWQFNYTQGASRYAVYVNDASGGANPAAFNPSYKLAAGWMNDAVIRTNFPGFQSGSMELTKVWGGIASFEHFWTPALRTSWYGGGFWVNYDGAAATYMCSNIERLGFLGFGNVTLTNPDGSPFTGSCNPNFGMVFLGTRTQWNIRPDFYVGVDVLYQRLETAFKNDFFAYAGLSGGPLPATALAAPGFTFGQTGTGTLYQFKDNDALSVTLRVHRDIVP